METRHLSNIKQKSIWAASLHVMTPLFPQPILLSDPFLFIYKFLFILETPCTSCISFVKAPPQKVNLSSAVNFVFSIFLTSHDTQIFYLNYLPTSLTYP